MSAGWLVILAAHGAGDASRANARVRAIAAEVGLARRDVRVEAAFHLGSPSIREVLREAPAGRTVVAPLMSSAGYFATEHLRAEIGTSEVVLLGAVGATAEAVKLLAKRVSEHASAAGLEPSRMHVIVVGHGTRRSAGSAESTVQAVGEIAAVLPGADVRAALLDQEPLLEDVAAGLEREHIVVAPFLIGGGDHVLSDVPGRLARAGASHAEILPPFGDDPKLPGLVVGLLEQAVPRRVVRIGTRTSRLAIWQAELAARAMRDVGIDVEIVGLSTAGDRDRETTLEGFATDGPFTDDIERALLRGDIDVAVHSCKDLPERTSPGTRIGAYLERGGADEALVSSGGRSLRDLPAGASVGTCSARRAVQVRRLRPDLRVTPIRGNVEERVAAVRRGEVDACVLAVAGLERLGLRGEAAQVFELDEIVPEAGQGAIVLQCRDDDSWMAEALRAIDHAETRNAVELERGFSAAMEERTGHVAGAHFREGVLRGRVMSRDGRICVDVEAGDAEGAVERALAALRGRGHVALVGAGPGDPGLMTVRGLELLRKAEVVVFDRLANPELLREAASDAELIDAGKLPGRHTLSQGEINETLVRKAAAGWKVVRLKGGDPFIYGRGWEEVAACGEAGIRCEVVPGVSSAIAAPAMAGIPVTARGVARTFAIVTPQSESGGARAALDYAALSKLDMVSVLMARGMLAEVAEGFISAGRDARTPAAVIENGTLATQRVVRGDLLTIAGRTDEQGISSPAVLVVGAAAGLSTSGGARGRLSGKRIVVTRPRSASAELLGSLRSEGAVVIDCPLIRIEYITPPNLEIVGERFDWLAVTSLHGVRGLRRALEAARLDARALRDVRIAAVGPKTAFALREIGLRADEVPSTHRAGALIEAMAQRASRRGERVLFPCGTLARDELRAGLRARGMIVDELPVYDTLDEAPSPEARRAIEAGVDAYLLYCPSAVRSARNAGLDLRQGELACIGPTTASAVLEQGLTPSVVASVHTDAGLIDELVQHFAKVSSSKEVAA